MLLRLSNRTSCSSIKRCRAADGIKWAWASERLLERVADQACGLEADDRLKDDERCIDVASAMTTDVPLERVTSLIEPHCAVCYRQSGLLDLADLEA